MDHAHRPWSQVTPVVFVVDDDLSVRKSLKSLMDAADWNSKTFGSGEEFLSSTKVVAGPSCVVLDLALPAAIGVDMPIIFISGHGDVPTTVRAMKAGAVGFFTKPLGGDTVMRCCVPFRKPSNAVALHMTKRGN